MAVSRRFVGRNALVTGGAGGIGRASAERLLAEGATVMIADLDADRLETTAAELGCEGSVLDVTDADSWERCLAACEDRLGELSVLVNAAGTLSTGSILDTSLKAWRRTRSVNLDGTFLGCRAAVPALRRAGGGAIVNLASTSGLRADPRTVAYDATKAGVRALTREVAVHCAKRGYAIRCNSVHPGSVATPMMSALAAEQPDLSEDWTATVPMARLSEPAEVAGMVAFLASEDAAFITGAEYVIDGGATL
jgi:NAD(P)-dependent dehydrogenase (short-subunit alcohol dehydrogenase family)